VGAVATNMAYPLADLVILSLLLGVFAMSGWKPGRGWLVLGGVFFLQAGFDTVYLYQVASGTYEAGTLLDLTWPAVMLAVALVAWQRPEVTEGSELQGWPALAITSMFAVIGLGLTTYDHWEPVSDVVVLLSTFTLVAAFVRAAATFGDMRKLAHSKDLLQHNARRGDACDDNPLQRGPLGDARA